MIIKIITCLFNCNGLKYYTINTFYKVITSLKTFIKSLLSWNKKVFVFVSKQFLAAT